MDWKTHVSRTLAGGEGYPVVEVIWYDAMAGAVDNWAEKATTTTMATTTVGYLIHEDDESMTLAGLINKTHVGHTITIPKGCVRSVVKWGTE